MMEHWNNGFWGIDGMGYRENQVEKTNEIRNPDLIHSVEDEFTSFHYSKIPLFHVAGIKKMPLKTYYFNKLYNFRDLSFVLASDVPEGWK